MLASLVSYARAIERRRSNEDVRDRVSSKLFVARIVTTANPDDNVRRQRAEMLLAGDKHLPGFAIERHIVILVQDITRLLDADRHGDPCSLRQVESTEPVQEYVDVRRENRLLAFTG